MAVDIKIPELGDNIESGVVVNILVKEGDKIEDEQSLIELETDKAVIEVPASSAGVVKKLLIKKGDEVKVGQSILQLDSNGQETQEEEKKEAGKESVKDKSEQKEEKTADKQEKEDKEEEQKESKSSEEEKKEAKSTKKGESVDFKVPNLGDGVEQGTITTVFVKKGDSIEKDQALMEMETDKAVIEVPSDVDGEVQEVLVKSGDTVSVGQKVFTISTASDVSAADGEAEEREQPEKEKAEKESKESESKDFVPDQDINKEEIEKRERESVAFAKSKKPDTSKLVPAAPSTRRFAREIGIDISQVPGTGPGGRISIDDVKAYSKYLNTQGGVSAGVVQAEPLPNFEKYGNIERESMSKLRQTATSHLSYAWSTIPHVTQFDKADITELEKIRKANGKKAEAAGGKLTMTAILIKIIEAALRKFPQFNASIDLKNKEIVYKKYFNIGIAVDTDRGLLVPVIKDVEKKNIIQLAVELKEISEKARDKKLSVEDMQGGNFSISNLGGIGGTAFTPIINSPDVAILGVSRAEVQPVYVDGEFKPKLMMPLALSYDHRLIDGADAARFLRWVCVVLEQPFNVLLEG